MKHAWRLAGAGCSRFPHAAAAAQLGHTLELHLLKKRGCFRRQTAAQAIPGRKLSQSSCSQRWFKYTKQKELPQSPELPCACTEFTRHFDTLWPPRNTARHLPCPFLTASAKRGHKASISATVHHLSLPAVHCSAAQLSTCGKSRHRAGQHSPELPESHQAQPQLQSCTGTERCSLLFIARISSGFHRLQSPTRLPTCQHLPGMSPRPLGTLRSALCAHPGFTRSTSMCGQARIWVSQCSPELQELPLPPGAGQTGKVTQYCTTFARATRTSSGDPSDPQSTGGWFP